MTGRELVERWPLGEQRRLAIELADRWAEPHRHYHDRTHLGEVLDRLDDLAGVYPVPLTVTLAAWYHDAVYDSQPEPEARSAGLARDHLGGVLNDRRVDEVCRLVMVTATHRPTGDDLAGQVLCDADLAILAADADRYERYRAGVRAEYAQVDQRTFDRSRRRVLAGLLEPAVFQTAWARHRWEPTARRNIGTELDHLERALAGDP